MLVPATTMPITLDVTTLFLVATCVTGLLGLLLLFAFAKTRIPALAWWGAAYLIGGCSVAAWSLEGLVSPPMPTGAANALLFIACGTMWNAARVFHGRPVLASALTGGAAIWLLACAFTDFAQWPAVRIVLSSVIVASYTFATAAELWRERRKTLRRRWPAIFVPMLHGAVFLFPIPLASLLPADRGIMTLSTGWVALFVLETLLYAVGTAFIVLVLATERSMRIHRDAAMTDELTGLLNRRGVLQAAQQMIMQQARKREPISALMFDLDHFKAINDTFGHAIGDKALHLFATTATAGTRTTDIVGRFGGEEFVALLPGKLSDAKIVAERIRKAFQAAGVTVAGCDLRATVSVGAASGDAGTDIIALLAAADAALYRAKANGRNRVELREGEEMPVLFSTPQPRGSQGRALREGAPREAARVDPIAPLAAGRAAS
ncbi:MAG TPA: GGDEF domain-containing protein [Xanthobacteraceae bacterium]|jgi:diguanylate cyclase (GGDEF)-like protein|nr:GGDEF domain-containing protein [Xanthobacteraceae bacterium]